MTEDEFYKIAAVSDEYAKRLREYDDSKFLKFLENFGLTIVFYKSKREVILKNNKKEARFSIFDQSWQDTPIDKTQLNAQARWRGNWGKFCRTVNLTILLMN